MVANGIVGQVCTCCVSDESFYNIKFDAEGVCNFCRIHNLLERDNPTGEEGKKIIAENVASMKKRNKNKEFDCVVGISGGRDSTFTLLQTKKLGLRPLAVHFNDGFGNPIAGENMTHITDKLNVPLRIVTSDWRESKALKIAFLKASTYDLEIGTDIGIATALYGQAAKEGIKDIIIGHSFRTEGLCPLEWNYLEGKYLKSVYDLYSDIPLRAWSPADPGFNLELKHMAYYAVLKQIRVFNLLYHMDYVRDDVTTLIKEEAGWRDPGAKYLDDLYQSLMAYVLRVKFGIDRRKMHNSAMVRSGQLSREAALAEISTPAPVEDQDTIELCIKRLGITRAEFEEILKLPPKTFHDYPNQYWIIRSFKLPIYLLSKVGILPSSTYAKYFLAA